MEVKIFGEFKFKKRTVIIPVHPKRILGLVKMTFGLYVRVHDASHGHTVKLTFFAPCS